MKILHLNLKKQWFDLIASGEKKEEYRELKPYWINRFLKSHYISDLKEIDLKQFKNEFNLIQFKNGYSKDAPTMVVECLGFSVGKANPEWSDGFEDECFVIKLGKILKK